MASAPEASVDRETACYLASFPYYVKTRKKGRRTYERTLVRGTHHGTMPVVSASETKPVFDVTHANGTKVRIDAWRDSLWAPMRDLNGEPLSFARFSEMLTGKDIELRNIAPAIHLFDPFSSPLNWKDGEPWGGVIFNGHISKNPEAPKDPAGTIEFDGEAEARARAARIADRMALINGAVCLRIPGPMWQVAKPDEERRRGARNTTQVVLRPEWRIPMRCINENFRYGYSVADHRPGPILTDGNFFAWNRKDDARTMAIRDDGSIVEEGVIEVLDRDLAIQLTRSGDDFAASGVSILLPIAEEASKQIFDLSDRGVENWTAVRRAARELSHIWFGDVAIARRGFRALDSLMEEFEESARNKHTSGANMVSFSAAAMRRWREFERPAATIAASADLAPQDSEAIASMRP